MPKIIDRIDFNGSEMQYRRNTNDLNVIKEVVFGKLYQRPSIGFRVESGENWLDLGAHIGSFAVYANNLGASVECYEPDTVCFSLLKNNVKNGVCFNTAVTTQTKSRIDFWKSTGHKNTSRGTSLDQTNNSKSEFCGGVANLHISKLSDYYDGIKMDIEGAEFSIIDSRCLPRCNKLCFEYHTSRDKSLLRFKFRLDILKEIFEVVSYPPSIDKMINKGGSLPRGMANLDRVIYCIGVKNPR